MPYQRLHQSHLTKLDVLDQLKELKIAVGYVIDGKELPSFLQISRCLQGGGSVQDLPGLAGGYLESDQWEQLPQNCRNYVEFIEQFLGVKIEWIGVGPARESMIHRA